MLCRDLIKTFSINVHLTYSLQMGLVGYAKPGLYEDGNEQSLMYFTSK